MDVHELANTEPGHKASDRGSAKPAASSMHPGERGSGERRKAEDSSSRGRFNSPPQPPHDPLSLSCDPIRRVGFGKGRVTRGGQLAEKHTE